MVTRVYKGKEHAEIEFTIGPISVADGIWKEIITQIKTTMKTNRTFYIDSNGRDFIKRVVRLASFQDAPSVPPYLTLPKLSKIDGDDSGMSDGKASEIAVGGGGVAVAVTRFPMEHKRPIGPLVVGGVKDGVIWLIVNLQRS
ncbi:hypothetical protein BVRB_6g145710 [Beta vulgaris subsp. vulgaris]|nr:hypothetical protein BVRB_6g145710 [Beta vulgaris subsp. vulgaris]